MINETQAREAWAIHWAGGSVRDIAAILHVSVSQAHNVVRHGAALEGQPYPCVAPLVGADAVRERQRSGDEARYGFTRARWAAQDAGVEVPDEELWRMVGDTIGIPHAGLCRLRAELA